MTHDQGEALSVADRVVLLASGRVVADDSPEGLWTHPPNAWAARFLGFRNLAPARVVGDDVETPWGRLPLAAVDRAASVDEGTLVLRPAALVTAAEGPVRGRVTSRRFRGDHVLLIVETGAAPPLHVEAREGELPTVGDTVVLSVLPGGAHLMPGDAEPGGDAPGQDQPPDDDARG